MSERKNRRYFFALFLSFSLIISPLDFSFFLNAPFAKGEVFSGEDSDGDLYEEWSGTKIISGYQSINSGVTVTVKPGTIVEFEGRAVLEVSGKLLVEGTPSNPVIFRKKNPDNPDETYSIVSFGEVRARNIYVSGGGSAMEVFMVENRQKRSMLNRAQAFWVYGGAFGAKGGGSLDIERANFYGNDLAVYTDQHSANQVKVWRSRFSGNTLDFVNDGGSVASRLQYNWWGSENGPAVCTTDCGEYSPRPYQKIIGKANLSDWAKEEYTKDPVIVIPGIMGSWKMTEGSELELDPISGTYDDLLATLDENGYEEGKNLFPFPYEWRRSNIDTAVLLSAKIDAVKAQTDWPKVDIVAHSMGGLIARQYIAQAYGNANNVDQFITLGTPHDGAPQDYLMWEGGDFPSISKFSVLKYLAEKIFQQGAEENGYETIFDYIRNAPIQSVRELLPTYSYLRDQKTGDMRAYPEDYPRNAFLENLKTSSALERLASVAFTNIVGNTGNETITDIRVGNPSIELLNDPEKIVLWGHGKPDGYDDLVGDRGLELGDGDGTVPLQSVKSIASDEVIELSSRHSALPSDAADIVYKTLTGLDTTASIIKKSQPESLLLIQVFSPIDIQIVSPSGLKAGKNFETSGTYAEIPGAYYTGFKTKSEFITIPNPEKGEYKILTQGTGDGGLYRIEATSITENEDGAATESTATIQGSANPGEEGETEIKVEETEEVIALSENDTTAPTVSIVSPEDGKTYQNSGTIPITYSAEDEKTTKENLEISIKLDETAYAKSDIDLSLLPLGAHTLKVSATDEAGNIGTMDANFTLETSWDALIKNIDHYAKLKLLKNKGETKMLRQQLLRLRQTADFLEKYDIFFRWHPKLRNIFEREVARRLSILQRYVKQKSGKSIDPLAASRLVEGMEAVKL